MAPRVIHVSDEVHAEAKAYCSKLGIPLKEWAESVLMREIRQATGKPATMPAAQLKAVSKKKLPAEVDSGGDNEPRPWELPPFWKRRPTGGPKEATEKEVGTQLEKGSREAPVGGGSSAGQKQ